MLTSDNFVLRNTTLPSQVAAATNCVSSVVVSGVSSFSLATADSNALNLATAKGNQLMILERKQELLMDQAKHRRRACEEHTCGSSV